MSAEIKEILNNAQSIARILIKQIVRSGDTVIDSTVGNGNDTVFLAELVGVSGTVYGFDIQEEALRNARAILPEALEERVEFLHASHATIAEKICEDVSLVLFNLGYLPGADRTITTSAEITCAACKAALQKLRIGGVILCVVYRGHAEGEQEWHELCAYGKTLKQNEYNFFTLDFPNQANNPPGLIAFQKR